MGEEQDERLWAALANAHRRRIVDLLASAPATTGELAERFPALSRFAVMQHLHVLEEAGLVVARRRGRHRFNHLNVAPLAQLYERWVGPLASRAAGEMLALKRFVEGTEETQMTTTGTVRTVRIENEIRFDAPQERVFHALTTEQDRWYPYNYGGERLRGVRFEPRVGGLTYEDWGDGAGVLYGTVTFWDPPRAVVERGFLKGAVLTENRLVIEPDGDGCVLKQSLVCFGEISDDDARGIESHGSIAAVEQQLRQYLEASGG